MKEQVIFFFTEGQLVQEGASASKETHNTRNLLEMKLYCKVYSFFSSTL